MLTCTMVRVTNTKGESVVHCAVPPAPANLAPGIYTFLCESDDESLTGRHLRFQWTGSEWKRNRNVHKETRKDFNGKENAKSDQDSWLNKPFVVTKTERTIQSYSPISDSNGSKPNVTTQLTVSKRAFNPGDILAFELNLKNCSRTIVKKLVISIVQKIMSIDLEKGRQTVVSTVVESERLSSQLFNDLKSRDISWIDNIYIPDLIPSTTLQPDVPRSVEVSYFLEFSLEMTDGRIGSKCGTPIIIKGKRKTSHKIRYSSIFES